MMIKLLISVFFFSLVSFPLIGSAKPSGTLILASGGAKTFVCYSHKRLVRASHGGYYTKYYNCFRSKYYCDSQVNAARHFGSYKSVSAAKKALMRCRSNSPRYIYNN